jgi:peptide/nickel transport system permease protein
MLIMIFSVFLGWLPSTGRGHTTLLLGVPVSFLNWDGLVHLMMPALNLALFKLSLLIRLTRAGTREAMLQDYVKFARAKGLPLRRIVGVHVLKNILIPIVTGHRARIRLADCVRNRHRNDLSRGPAWASY